MEKKGWDTIFNAISKLDNVMDQKFNTKKRTDFFKI
jgi:hypothetical protein